MPEHDNWDTHWDRYAASASQNPAQQMRHAIIAKLLAPGLDGWSAHVLDIGSGQGDLLVKLRAQFPEAQLMGFELSASGVELSRQKIPDATFVVADLFQPPTEVKQYAGWATDAVCSEVLEHVDSPADFLRAARPYLADNARLIVTVPGGPMSAFDRHIGHRRHFTPVSISAALRAAGFTVKRVYLSGFPFFNLYRAMVIARGAKLATDVDATQTGGSSKLANGMMAVFRGLFRFNLVSSPFGWQVVVVARKTRAEGT
jgi:SAM-dependent methyltransferase